MPESLESLSCLHWPDFHRKHYFVRCYGYVFGFVALDCLGFLFHFQVNDKMIPNCLPLHPEVPPPPSLASRVSQSDCLNWCFTAVSHQNRVRRKMQGYTLHCPCLVTHFMCAQGEVSPSHPPPAGTEDRGIGLTAPGVRPVVKPSQLALSLEDDQKSPCNHLLSISVMFYKYAHSKSLVLP